MQTIHQVDLIILGSGIAGLSLADVCCRLGISCAVIDTKGPASGASGAPLGLLNPATGRRARKSWQAELAIETTNNLVSRITEDTTGSSFVHRNGVIRPAASNAIAGEMLKQLKKSKWPTGWVKWLDAMEFRDRFPDFTSSGGALWVPVASTISLSGFTHALAEDVQKRGAALHISDKYQLNERAPWHLRSDTFAIKAPKLVCATGYHLAETSTWQAVPLHGVKGQVLTVTLSRDFPCGASLSSRGYIAVNPEERSKVVLGSTYEHSFSSALPDGAGQSVILKRHEANWPHLSKSIQTSTGWAGIRVTTPDRKPVAGAHQEIDGLYILGGLGSKGLMQGPLTANYLAHHIFRGASLPGAIDVKRFY